MKLISRSRFTCLLLLLLGPGALLADGLKLEAGAVPPDRLGQITGEDVLVSDHRGQLLIVTFWATWCGPCMKELPVLNAIQQHAGADRVRVIAVNLKEGRKQFRRTTEALESFEITFLHDARGTTARRYDVKGLPNMFIIDVDGLIVHRHIGYGEGTLDIIVDEINALLVKNELYGAGE